MEFKNKWKEYTLSDISNGKGQYGISKPGESYGEGKIRYLRITDITDDGFLQSSGKIYIKVNDIEYNKYILRENDIVFARTGASAGRSYLYNKEDENLIVAGFLIRFNLNSKIVNPKYIRYYTLSRDYKAWVDGISTGSTRPNINEKMFSSMPIKLPNIKIQNCIVKILGCLEDKAKNNNAIIANLEAQAQAIFKSWFIDFEPFQDGKFVDSELGEIPEGWEVSILQEIAKEIITGKTPSTKEKDNYGEDIPFITIPDMHNNVFVVETERYLSNKGANSQPKKTLRKNSIIISCIATVGLVSLISEDSHTNQQINGVIPKNNISPYFIYSFFKTQSKFLNNIGSSGSATKNVNKNTFSNIKLILPSQKILDSYNSLCEPIFEYILSLQKQNIRLRELRDTLLPKLMSGEVRVGQEDIE